MPGGIAAHHPPGEDHLTRQIAALRTEVRRLRAGTPATTTTTAAASAVTARAFVLPTEPNQPTEALAGAFDADTVQGFTGPALTLPLTGPVRVSIDCDQVLIDPGSGSATAGLSWGIEGSTTTPVATGPGPRAALLRTDAGTVGGSLHRSGTVDAGTGTLIARAWVHCTDPDATVTFGPCTLRVDPL